MARTAGSDGKKTGAAIREKALTLIVRHGFEALTMRKLAAAVGVQAGALYHYFPDKQSMLSALIADHMNALLALAQKSGTDMEAPARLRAFVAFHIQHHIANRSAAHVANNELRSLNRENFAAILKIRGAYERLLRNILREGVDAGDFQMADVALTTMALLAMSNEVCVWFREGGALSIGQVAAEYADMAVRAVSRR